MPLDTKVRTALSKQVDRFREAVGTADPERMADFWAPEADLISPSGILRGRAKIRNEISRLAGAAALKAELSHLHGSAAHPTTNARQLNAQVVVVDGRVGEDEKNTQGWYTEVWKMYEGKWLITASRLRSGSATSIFTKLNAMQPTVEGEDVSDAIVKKESKTLRSIFPKLRAAWKASDVKGMEAGLAKDADAIATFGFLDNRAQIINGSGGIAAKMERMNGSRVINVLSPGASASTLTIGGEAKSIRFLSNNVAVVDGTVELSGVPPAHGFAPAQMKGIYTDLWVKQGAAWKIVGTRPWF